MVEHMPGSACNKQRQEASLGLASLQEISRNPHLAASQVMALLSTLRTADEELRAWAADCLQLVTRPPQDVVPQLALACSDACPPVAVWACILLGRLGEQALPWQDALVVALQQHDSLTVRQQAARALGQITGIGAAALAALEQATACNDPRLQRLATQALESVAR